LLDGAERSFTLTAADRACQPYDEALAA